MSTEQLNCPRDGAPLERATEHGIQIDRCRTCKGAWYDRDELALLEEAAGASEDQRRGSIDYAVRESALTCPVCGGPLQAFNYRAYNLELDACKAEHGFWLDGGEAERVREVMQERMRGLERSAKAEAEWDPMNRHRSGGVLDRLRGLFR